MADTTLPPGTASQTILSLIKALGSMGSNQPYGGTPYQFVPGQPVQPQAAPTPTPGYDPIPYHLMPPGPDNPQPGLTSPFQPYTEVPNIDLTRPYRPGEAMGYGDSPLNPIAPLVRGLRSVEGMIRAPAEAGVEPFPVAGPPPDQGPQLPGSTGVTDDSGMFIPYDANAIPAPPTVEAPPGVDMDKIKSGRMNSILGSLALGAASVDPTSPGSFARALAAAGGAGAAAAGEAQLRMAEIAQKNAQGAYEASWKNKELEYGHKLKMHELMLPNIKATEDAIMIQEYDKEKGGYNVRVIKTDGVLQDADKLAKLVEATEGSGPIAEATKVELISKIYKNDPAAATGTLLRMTIENAAKDGTARAIFGEKFENIEKDTHAEVIQQGGAGIMTKPEEYRKEYSKRIAAKILSDPELMKDQARWLAEAADFGSISARILSQGINARATN